MAQILIIGSGLSANLGMHSWTRLLSEIARKNLAIEDANQIDNLTATPGREYEAATRLATYLGGEHSLEQKVVQVLQNAQKRIENSPTLLRLKPSLAASHARGIITTNWDTLLASLGGFELLVWPSDVAREADHLQSLERCLRQRRKFVWHLHGALGTDGLVITERQRETREKAIKRYEERIATILAQHDVYALASSFPDPHLVGLIETCVERTGERKSVRALTGDIGISRLKTVRPEITINQYPELRLFYEALVEFVTAADRSYELIGLDSLSGDDLLRKLQGFEWRHRLISAIKDATENTRNLADSAARAAIEAFRTGDTEAAGILSTILSTSAREWDPERLILDELRKIVRKGLAVADPKEVLSIEPLAWALGRKGEGILALELHRSLLANEKLGGRHHDRYSHYYADAITRYGAYTRHLRERPSLGILAAWDLPSLMVELEAGPLSVTPHAKRLIKRALQELSSVDIKLATEFETKATRLLGTREPVKLT